MLYSHHLEILHVALVLANYMAGPDECAECVVIGEGSGATDSLQPVLWWQRENPEPLEEDLRLAFWTLRL